MVKISLAIAAFLLIHDPSDPNHDWYKAQRSQRGIPCCDMADSHPAEWRWANCPPCGYEVFINKKWWPVPPEAVILGARSPTGDAIVWYVQTKWEIEHPDDAEYYVRCFIPGGGA